MNTNYIKSDKEFLDSQMDNILSSITTGESTTFSFFFTTKVPSSEATMANNLLSVCDELYSKLINDINMIKEAGVKYQQLDTYMREGAESIAKDESEVIDL